ncbi:MAG: putative Ig domain-containing protein, partial [Planctomycetaceae bacterium]|nr:putative Ig domain-containing protein [Planctomycetaceae bacterium]
MQQREKILAGVLGASLVGWLGLPMLEDQFLAPLNELELRETQVQESIDKKFAQRKALSAKDAELTGWKGISLPPDPLDAQRLYQEWLINIAQQCGFEQPMKVTLERRIPQGETYVTIPIKLETKAKLQELALFLERFHSVDLLHRIASLQVTSPASEGDPELTVVLVAEGASMTNAESRTRLFAQAECEQDVSKETQTIEVFNETGFPEEAPFRVRIGEEFLNVIEKEGQTWKVQRGVAKTFAADHPAGSAVEHFPLKAEQSDDQDVVAMWSQSLFTKPAPEIQYDLKLASTNPPPAVRGREWRWKLDLSGWNPAYGSPNYELVSAPEKVKLNERTGELSWNVESGANVGDVSIEALVWGTNGRNAGFAPSVKVKVRDPNRPPVVEGPQRMTFYIGRESRVSVQANDPDGTSTGLKYELEAAPEGMTINSSTGEIRWNPPETLAPQDFNVSVKVTDSDELAESVTRQIPVTLQEDSARFTYLTGTIQGSSGQHRVMITDRITNRRLTRHVGERVQVADLDLLIKEIGNDYMIVSLGEDPYRIEFEQPFAAME